MSPLKFSVAICGGGIGGLTTAIALSCLSQEKKDIRVDLHEAAHRFTEIGAGVALWRRPWKIMKSLGLEEELLKLCDVAAIDDKPRLVFEMRKSDQKQGVHFYDMVVPMGGLSFHRAEFLDTLVRKLDPETTSTHFSKRLKSYTLPPASVRSAIAPITLNFDDGTTAVCDVLIGADGIHSATRHTLLELAIKDAETTGSEDGKKTVETLRKMFDPVWSGSIAYRAIVSREKLEKINQNHRAMVTFQNYTGKSKHIITYPISHGHFINVVAMRSWPDKAGTVFEGNTVEPRSKEELLEQYVGWEEEVQQLLQCVGAPSRWAINTMNGLPISTHDRVALAGDSAHAMTPHQGSGAGQAIEDAYILSALLAHPLTTLSTLRTALKVYEKVRLPHGNEVQRLSAENGRLREFDDARFSGLIMDLHDKTTQPSSTDAGKLWEIGHTMIENWKWAWTTDIEDDRERAIALLKEHVSRSTCHRPITKHSSKL
ncbi:hypothetical protein M0805_001947 [Coniferiporia weirii]|nr:hypothetical protein M0805_001947 [Coniferiporia weirii]